MRVALAIGSFFILVVHGLVFYKQFFHEWERYQATYFDQARNMAKTDAEKVAVTNRAPRIEQFIVTNFGDTKVDRCATCHAASDDPRFTNLAHPTKTHPYSAAMGDTQQNGKWERRHKFSDFGCTVCHDGQGRGLSPEYSHGKDEYWPDPLLGYVAQENWKKEYAVKLKGKEFMEANCAQCHTDENFAGTPHVARGRRLFYSTNCYGCHRIEGLSDGTLGPDLTEVGRKWKLDYLYESIVDPRANLATSIMPKFNLPEEDVKSLVIFLKSRKGKNLTETEVQRYKVKLTGGAELVQANVKPVAITPATMVQQGEKLVADRACTACHRLGQRDGGIAPDLTFEGLIKPEDWIYAHFKNPRTTVPDSIMPTFRFTDDEFKAITAYLGGSKTPPKDVGNGENVYRTLCSRCHGEKGDGHGPIAIYLDPYPRDLTKAGFINSKPLERLRNSVKHGVGGTSMPAWTKVLNDEQVNGVLEYVFTSFTKEKRRELKPLKAPDTNPVVSNAESISKGERLFVQRCSGCHGKKADGKGPNSLDILPRPRNLRNSWFVNSVQDRRLFESIKFGVQGTAMPSWVDYGLQDSDVGDLVNFIRSMNQKAKGSQQYASAN